MACAQTESRDAVQRLSEALEAQNTQQVTAIENELLSAATGLNKLLEAGSLLAEKGRLEESARLFERSRERFPASFEARYNLALARFALNQLVPAQNALEGAQPSSEREKSAILYLQGKIQMAAGDMANAKNNLEEAYRRAPQEENYALDLALLYIRSSAYVPAADLLEAAIVQQHLTSNEIRLELALADALAGRAAKAIAASNTLAGDTNTRSIAALITTFAYCHENDFAACRADAAQALAAPQPHPYLHYLRASALWNLSPQETQPILDDLNIAVEKLPACGVCLQLRSRVYESTGKEMAAIVDLQRSVTIDPQSAAAWYRLFQLYKKTGKKPQEAEALRHYQAIHKQQTDDEADSFRSQFTGSAAGSRSAKAAPL